MPGRSVSVARIAEAERLLVPVMGWPVRSTVREVDATDERDIVISGRPRGAVHDDDLLVMAPTAPDSMVEHDLTTGVVDRARHQEVGDFRRAVPGRVRSPQQPAYRDTALRRIGEHRSDLRPGPGEQLVAVALQIRQVDPVAGVRGAQLLEQRREVPGAVDQHGDVVALRPCLVITAPAIDPRRRVATLGVRQEPVVESALGPTGAAHLRRTCNRTTTSPASRNGPARGRTAGSRSRGHGRGAHRDSDDGDRRTDHGASRRRCAPRTPRRRHGARHERRRSGSVDDGVDGDFVGREREISCTIAVHVDELGEAGDERAHLADALLREPEEWSVGGRRTQRARRTAQRARRHLRSPCSTT